MIQLFCCVKCLMCAGWKGVLREGNASEAVYFTAGSMYNGFVVFGDDDVFFREGGRAMIIAEFAY